MKQFHAQLNRQDALCLIKMSISILGSKDKGKQTAQDKQLSTESSKQSKVNFSLFLPLILCSIHLDQLVKGPREIPWLDCLHNHLSKKPDFLLGFRAQKSEWSWKALCRLLKKLARFQVILMCMQMFLSSKVFLFLCYAFTQEAV